MPYFILNTNLPKSAIPDNFLKELSALLAKQTGKPEMYMCIQVKPDQMMTYAGTEDPCALCFLGCIGKLGVEENKQHTTAFMDKLHNDLKIPKDRMYIFFSDCPPSECGWNGKTFAS